MELQQLLSVASVYGAEVSLTDDRLAQIELAGIAYDSRKVGPDYLFVAIPGALTDGHKYIRSAVEAGAIAVVAEHALADWPPQAALILTNNSRSLLSRLAAAYYGHPEQELRMIGVTGTNGKTTTAYLIKFLLDYSGAGAGLIGTVHNQAGQWTLPATLTTPESLDLFELFALMRAEGCRAVVMEASSHALSQGRTACCNFSGAVFTNLTQDHLDYHGSMKEYLAAKASLFSNLKDSPRKPAYGVVNCDDGSAGAIIAASAAPVWTFGCAAAADLRLKSYQIGFAGSRFCLEYDGSTFEVKMPLIGKFNIYNALAALTCAAAEGLDMAECVRALERAPQAPGRFELVQAGQGFTVAVDYAHTPDGLENVLKAARELKPKRLISVFGCGGNRDSGKRPLMGRISVELSDMAIITTDNPRFEEPLEIISGIEQGAKEAKGDYLVEADRAKAIELAINMADEGSLVVIAGKGHEDYQIVRGVKRHFDDREQARAAIERRLAINS